MASFADVYTGVLATIAEHSQAQDDGRVQEMVALYVPDAVVEIPQVATLEGVEAIEAAFSQPQWRPDPSRQQRHIVTNTVLTEWSDHEAKATSDVVLIRNDGTAWLTAIVARYHDEFREVDGRWLLTRRADEYVSFTPPAD